MSQKVRIDGVKHAGASVFLGVDHCGNLRWTRNPERIMVWLCDGWRTRFNQRREQRPHNVPVKDEAGEIIDWIKEPLGGPDVAELLSDKEARLRCSWMAAVPSSILATSNRLEGTEWSAGIKRKKTIGGRVPGFKSRRRGLGFVCWYRPSNHSYNAVFQKTGRKSGVVVITGMNPSRWVKPGEKAHWRIVIHVRVTQEIRPYTSVHVDWTHRTLVFVNMPLPLPRTGGGVIGLDRGCVHTLASSDGTFMDMPKPSKAELKRLKYLQRRMARQNRVNEARGGKPAKFASKRRQKTLSQFNVLQSRIIRRKNDWIEKTTTRLAQENILVAMETLCVKGLMRTRMGKSVADAAWSTFTDRVDELCAQWDRKVVHIDRWCPSSQVCSQCGRRDGPKPLNVREWECPDCGAFLDRDYNAALNILDAAGLAESLNARGGDVRRRLASAGRDAIAREAGTHRTAMPPLGWQGRDPPPSGGGGSQDWELADFEACELSDPHMPDPYECVVNDLRLLAEDMDKEPRHMGGLVRYDTAYALAGFEYLTFRKD